MALLSAERPTHAIIVTAAWAWAGGTVSSLVTIAFTPSNVENEAQGIIQKSH